MSLEAVLNNIQFSDENSDAFDNQTTALLTNLYENGGAKAVLLLDLLASQTDRNYLITQIDERNAQARIREDDDFDGPVHEVIISYELMSQVLHLTSDGRAVHFSMESVLIHELAHLAWGTGSEIVVDPLDGVPSDLSVVLDPENNSGNMVELANSVRVTLGEDYQRPSYFNQSTDGTSVDLGSLPTELFPDYDYTPIDLGLATAVFVDAGRYYQVGGIDLTGYSSEETYLIVAADGATSVTGSDGTDYVHMGHGSDTVFGSLGTDFLSGGIERFGHAIDTLNYSALANSVGVFLDPITDANGDDVFTTVKDGTSGDGDYFTDFEVIILTSNDDDVLVNVDQFATFSDMSINGQEGIDSLYFFGDTEGLVVDLEAGVATLGEETLQITNFENILGDDATDWLNGDDEANAIVGGGGADILAGGAGNDVIVGGADGDVIDGGVGWDSLYFGEQEEGVTVNLVTGVGLGGDAAGDTYTNIEAVGGTEHNDEFTTIITDQTTFLSGGGGQDTFNVKLEYDDFDGSGREGVAIVFGGEGQDTFDLQISGYPYHDIAAAAPILLLDVPNLTDSNWNLLDVDDIETQLGLDLTAFDMVIINPDADDIFQINGQVVSVGAGGAVELNPYGDPPSHDSIPTEVDVAYEAFLLDGEEQFGENFGVGIADIDIGGLTGVSAQTFVEGFRLSLLSEHFYKNEVIDWTLYGSSHEEDRELSGYDPEHWEAIFTSDILPLTDGGYNFEDDAEESGDGDGEPNDDMPNDDLPDQDYHLQNTAYKHYLYLISGLIEHPENDFETDFAIVGGSLNGDTLTSDGSMTYTMDIPPDGIGTLTDIEQTIGELEELSPPTTTPPTTTPPTTTPPTITGTNNSESIEGTEGNDQIFDNGGDDVVNGGDGRDTFYAGDGADQYDGGTDNNDSVNFSGATQGVTVDLADVSNSTGFAAGDTYTNIEAITGSLHDDMIVGNGSVFKLNGGAGDDVIVSGTRNNITTGGDGADTFVFNTGSKYDRIKDFTVGEDLLDVSGWGAASLADLTLDDSSGNVIMSFGTDSVRVDGITSVSDLSEADFVFGTGVGIVPVSDGIITGTSGDDIIDGSFAGDPEGDVITDNGDTINAGAGNDTIHAGAGDDKIYDGDGDDIVFGGDGRDTFFGGAGEDQYDGGNGNNDSLTYSLASQGVTVDLADVSNNTGIAAGDTYTNIEAITGSAHDDLIVGNGSVFKLNGGAGDDVIVSGTRNNITTGGDGADTFVFNTGSKYDRLKDFNAGEDLLDVSGWGAASLADLTLDDSSGNVIVSFGTDSVRVDGITSVNDLSDNDFVFV